MKGILPNSWSREATVQSLELKKTRWSNLQTPSKVSKELRELLELERRCVRCFLGKWKINSGQVMCTQHLPEENAVGNSRAKLQACKD